MNIDAERVHAMRDWDWLNAMYLGCFGFAVGPFLGFASWQFNEKMKTVTGNAWAPLGLLYDPVTAVIGGVAFGSLLGLCWGLMGESFRDWLHDASAFLARKLRKRRKKKDANPPDASETSTADEPASPPVIVGPVLEVRRTIPLADLDDQAETETERAEAEPTAGIAEESPAGKDASPQGAEPVLPFDTPQSG